MYVQILGTPVVDALLGDLADQNVIASPASLDSDWVREANLLPVGAPYQLQAINSIDWYYSQAEHEGDVLCTIASDDEYGDAGVEGIDYIADKLGIEVAQKSTFPTVDRPGRAELRLPAGAGARAGRLRRGLRRGDAVRHQGPRPMPSRTSPASPRR